ncbi:MAG: hypothetical protein SOV59_03645 [Fusobacterium mortiferum]|nr:hypothetical protein [Fusobacterium mortiferum]
MVQKEKKYITWEGLNQHAKNVGKKIKECDTGVIGGYNGSFPLTAATKGNIYLLPATKKYYVCIKNYNGSQLTAPNANFEELSVYTNRSKLDNLSGIIISLEGYGEYQITQRGLYLLAYFHAGLNEQNYLTAISLHGSYSLEDKWYTCERIISSQWHSTATDFEYNPYQMKVRNKTRNSRKITLHLLSSV